LSGKGKGKRKTLFADEKRHLLESYDSLPKTSQRDAAQKLGIPQPTLSKILKDRESIKQNEGDRKRMRSGKTPKVKVALKWIRNARERNAPLSGPLVMQKAEELAVALGVIDFKASTGWFEFKNERGLFLGKCMEKPKTQTLGHVTSEWLENEWIEMRHDFAEEDIWNADESGIYFRALPDGTLTFKSDNKKGGKKSKERITALFICSMAGKKKDLFIIGSQNPRCFKNVRHLPVRYAANASAWMTGYLFGEWLKDWDRKLGQEKRKILLLVDNCTAHVTKDVALRFLPKNTTSILQPCDQGIIRTAKAYFRKQMARTVLHHIDDENNKATAVEIARKISLLDAILMLANAWSDVDASTIRNCWKKGGLVIAPMEEAIVVEPPRELNAHEFEEWMDIDDNAFVMQPVSDEDIVTEIRDQFDVKPENNAEADSDDD
uniref:HTH CENPB-type domain-containing protein n=1 Tax=Latimeria chalumnae TaxID=7897 RepID=H3ABS0_LATCH